MANLKPRNEYRTEDVLYARKTGRPVDLDDPNRPPDREDYEAAGFRDPHGPTMELAPRELPEDVRSVANLDAEIFELRAALNKTSTAQSERGPMRMKLLELRREREKQMGAFVAGHESATGAQLKDRRAGMRPTHSSAGQPGVKAVDYL